MARTLYAQPHTEVLYFKQGNFTIAVIVRKGTNIILSLGVTKRNPTLDEPDDDRGMDIATRRAILDKATYIGVKEL